MSRRERALSQVRQIIVQAVRTVGLANVDGYRSALASIERLQPGQELHDAVTLHLVGHDDEKRAQLRTIGCRRAVQFRRAGWNEERLSAASLGEKVCNQSICIRVD